MSARRIKTVREEKTEVPLYLKKAQDNREAMLLSLRNGNYNAAGTLALQCAISSADAVCINQNGVRSLSQNHLDLCDLVKSITLHEAKDKSNTLRRIISKKNIVQYESRNIYKKEAEDIVRWTEGFFTWVLSVVNE